MSLWRRVLAERRGLVIPLLAAVAVNIAVRCWWSSRCRPVWPVMKSARQRRR